MKISPQLLWLLSGRCLFHVQAVEKNLNKDILPQPPVRRCHASVAIGSKCQFGGIHQVRANITQKESPWCEFQSSVWSALHVLCFEGCCLNLVKQQSWSGPLGRMVSEKICNSCGVFSHSKGVGAELFSGHYGSLGRIGLPEGSTKRQGSAKRSCGGLPTILDICLPHGCCFKRVLWSVPPAVPYIYIQSPPGVKVVWSVDMSHPYYTSPQKATHHVVAVGVYFGFIHYCPVHHSFAVSIFSLHRYHPIFTQNIRIFTCTFMPISPYHICLRKLLRKIT